MHVGFADPNFVGFIEMSHYVSLIPQKSVIA